jgi:glycine cleavage system regulatory protein
MQTALVMTIIGEDKPGLVESVSSIVAEHGGNWLESRMSRLGGYFAGILRIELPEEKARALTSALKSLNTSRGLEVVVHADTPAAASTARPRTKRLDIVGQDRPGIVRQIAQALARQGVNVEELSSETSSAAMSGETLFRAGAVVALPDGCDLSALRQELEKIAADLIVDVSLEDEPDKDDGLA